MGRIVEVSSISPNHAYIQSPLGAVQKKHNGIPAGWRRIHDLSHPVGSSVNDGIPLEFGFLSYQTLDDAINLITKYGKDVPLQKRDLKDAFRKIPVSPYDHWLLLFEWDDKIYVDLRLPFGSRTSPFTFNYFSEGIHWIVENRYQQSVVHYLDDFLLVGCTDPTLFAQISAYLGFEHKPSKAIDGQVVDFVGIELDSHNMEARLPQDKHIRAIEAVTKMLNRGYTSHNTLETLIGFLSFCTRVIPLGRPFLRQLLTFSQHLSQLAPNVKRRLPAAARSDLEWWRTFLYNWSGIRIIHPRRTHIFVYTDASGKKGIGGWYGTDAFSSNLPRDHYTKHINWKEAYAILFALAKWGESWKGYRITFMCDNSAIVDAIQKTTIRGEAIFPLQHILLTAALYDIEISSLWLSSEDNWIADSLSRFNLKRLANLQLDVLFSLQNQDQDPVPILLTKLRSSYNTVLPPLQDLRTTPHGRSLNASHESGDIPTASFQQHSK
jgi:hypothetical protein